MSYIKITPDLGSFPLLMRIAMPYDDGFVCDATDFIEALKGSGATLPKCTKPSFIWTTVDSYSTHGLDPDCLGGHICLSCMPQLFGKQMPRLEVRFVDAVLRNLRYSPKGPKLWVTDSAEGVDCSHEGCQQAVGYEQVARPAPTRPLCAFHAWEEFHNNVDETQLELFLEERIEKITVEDCLSRAVEWYESFQTKLEPVYAPRKAFPHTHYMLRPSGVQHPSTAFLQNPQEKEMLDNDYRELAALGRLSRYRKVDQERVAFLQARCAKKGLLPFTPLSEPGCSNI